MNKIKIACFAALALLIAGFAAARGTGSQGDLSKLAVEPVVIKAIDHSESEGWTELVIRANTPFEYTSYDPDPGVLIIEIPEGNIESLPPVLSLETDQVKDVKVKKITSKQGDFFIGRIEISYWVNGRHTLFMEGNDLHIKMENSEAVAKATGNQEAPVPAASGQGGQTAGIVRTEQAGSTWTSPPAAPEQQADSASPDKANEKWASMISTINIDDKDDSYTEFIIEGDGKLLYDSFKIDNPERVVLDIQNVSMLLPGKNYNVNSPYVERVRASQYKTSPEKIARVVFDMKKDAYLDVTQSGSLIKVRFSDAPTEASSSAASETVAAVQEIKEEAAQAVRTPSEQTEVQKDMTQPQIVENVPTQPVENSSAAPAAAQQYSTQDVEKVINEKAKEDYVIFREKPETLAGVQEEEQKKTLLQFQTVKVTPEEVRYTGKKISLNLVDADLKQVFRLFHEISGLNFVLDPAVAGKVTIVLDNVPWDQALDIILKNNGLDKIFENNVIRIASTTKMAQEAASRKNLKDAKELEADPVTITRTLSYAKSNEVEKVIRQSGMISARGRVIMDERTNSLIVTDVPTRIPPIDNLISSIDSETPQVMIEARIVETSRQFVQDFGIKWGFTAVADAAHGTQTNLQFPHNAKVDYALNLPFTPLNAVSPNLFAVEFGNVLNSFNLDLAIEALEVDGKARVLSAPKIATQNNEKAEIERGVRIPIVNTTATEINVEFVSASLRLEVTPQITAEGTIVLDIIVENNTPDFVNRVGDVPPINTQRAQTVVLINDGGTTVIGGIFSQTEGLSEAGVPWFRKIPVFGWLFKRRNITNEDRELLIFLTARIMRSSS